MDSTTLSSSKESATHSRRLIVRFLIAFPIVTTLVGVFTPILGYVVPPETGDGGGSGRLLAGSTEDIPVGQGKVLPMGSQPVIVINTDQGVKAFSAVCTHLGCICTWDAARNIILCPCHDGRFNPITGAVISGPPPAPLPAVAVSVENGDIYLGEA